MKPILSILFGLFLGLSLFGQGCGSESADDSEAVDDGGTFSEETITLAVTVAEPVSADLSVPALTIGKRGLTLKSPAMATEASEGTDVMITNCEGFPTIYGCTTDANGFCEAEVPVSEADCFILKANNDDIVMQSVESYTEEEVEALVASGEVQIEGVTPATDLTTAMAKAACDGNLGDCPLDMPSLVAATDAMVADAATRDDHDEGTTGASLADLVAVQEELILNVTGKRSANMMAEALINEETNDIEALTGPFGDTLLADANVAGDAIADAYCDPTNLVWREAVDDAAAEEGLNVDDVAKMVVSVIEESEPDEVADTDSLEFQNAALAITAVGDIVTKGATSTAIKQAIAELMRMGGMNGTDIDVVKQAMGLLVATFPEDISTLNGETAARAAYLFNADLVSQGATRYDPVTLASTHATALKDPSVQLSIVAGGISTYLTNFIADPAGFNASSNKTNIKSAMGSTCTQDSDCAAAKCVGQVCTADSYTMGTPCDDNDDCISGELCAGHRRRICMRADSVPNTMYTFASGGIRVVRSDVSISSGEAGSPCPCNSGFTCTSSTASAGICRPNTLTAYKGPGMTCLANSECVSNTCTSGLCGINSDFLTTMTSIFGTLKELGGPCASHFECKSQWCNAGRCDSPPSSVLGLFSGITLLGPGAACTANNQCQSFFCNGGFCGSYSGSGTIGTFETGTVASGGTCNYTSQCQSGLNCISGTCAAYTAFTSCNATSQCPSDAYCKEFTCVAKSTAGGTCAPTTTSTIGNACTAGLYCNVGANLCAVPKVTVVATFPAPVTNKNFQCWIGTSAQYTSALYLSPVIPVSGGQATVLFPTVAAGTYFVGGWVDNNNNGARDLNDFRGFHNGLNTSKPAAVASVVVPVSDNINVTFPLYTVPSVIVNLTLLASVTNKHVRAWIGTVSAMNSGLYFADIASFTGTTALLTFPNVPAGTYFVGGWADIDASGAPNSGDKQGYHNGAGVNPPGGPSATVPAAGDFTVNITAGTL
ncbi:MAG: hypothetical protein HYU99_04225 [Deltaproteobacteria bacterium]|nr:hypothetical protein [Deltaproteobacteria bacterium]